MPTISNGMLDISGQLVGYPLRHPVLGLDRLAGVDPGSKPRSCGSSAGHVEVDISAALGFRETGPNGWSGPGHSLACSAIVSDPLREGSLTERATHEPWHVARGCRTASGALPSTLQRKLAARALPSWRPALRHWGATRASSDPAGSEAPALSPARPSANWPRSPTSKRTAFHGIRESDHAMRECPRLIVTGHGKALAAAWNVAASDYALATSAQVKLSDWRSASVRSWLGPSSSASRPGKLCALAIDAPRGSEWHTARLFARCTRTSERWTQRVIALTRQLAPAPSDGRDKRVFWRNGQLADPACGASAAQRRWCLHIGSADHRAALQLSPPRNGRPWTPGARVGL